MFSNENVFETRSSIFSSSIKHFSCKCDNSVHNGASSKKSLRTFQAKGKSTMRIVPPLRNATKICVALSLLCLCAFLKAQSSPCGSASGTACPSNCGNGPQGFTFQYGGPDYGITAWIPCGNCGMTQVNIYSSPECMPIGFGLNRQAIQSLLASANGRQVLMPACGGGFRPLLEPPLAVAQERWEFPKHRQIILR